MDTIDVAKLGIEAEAFLRSSLGRHMMQRVELLIQQSTEELIACDSFDGHSNQEIRNTIKVCQLFKAFIQDAIEEGRIAVDELEADEAR